MSSVYLIRLPFLILGYAYTRLESFLWKNDREASERALRLCLHRKALLHMRGGAGAGLHQFQDVYNTLTIVF